MEVSLLPVGARQILFKTQTNVWHLTWKHTWNYLRTCLYHLSKIVLFRWFVIYNQLCFTLNRLSTTHIAKRHVLHAPLASLTGIHFIYGSLSQNIIWPCISLLLWQISISLRQILGHAAEAELLCKIWLQWLIFQWEYLVDKAMGS